MAKSTLFIIASLLLASPAYAQGGLLWGEEDGSPDNVAVFKALVTNGGLTNNNDGTVSLDFTAGINEWTDTGTILHPTDSSGTLDEVVIGGTTEAAADIFLGVDGGAVFNEQANSTGDFRVESDSDTHHFFIDYSTDAIGIDNSAPDHTLDIVGEVQITHVATENTDHAMDVITDAAGFGDVKAVNISYDTGTLSGGESESAILVSFDESESTGGDLHGMTVLSTATGSAEIHGMEIGVAVNPIVHLSGTFGDMDSALVKTTNRLTEFITSGNNIVMFVDDGDTITIGDIAKYVEIEFVLATVASGGGISPTFEFSTGVGPTFSTFSPNDGTNGMKVSGTIQWELEDISSWAIDGNNEFLIRITRTRNTVNTDPIEDKVQISAGTVFEWDKNGDLSVNTVTSTTAVPRFILTDTTASADDFELVADESTVRIVNTTDGVTSLIHYSDNSVGLGEVGFEPPFIALITDGTGDGELELPSDSIGTREINWAGLEFTRSIAIENLAAADDNISMGSWSRAVMIEGIWVTFNGTGTTVANISLEDGSGNAMTHSTPIPTADGTIPDRQEVTAGGDLTPREKLRFDVDNSVDPETDEYTINVAWTFND